MNRKSTYHTKHMDAILSYMQTVSGKHVTVADVCAHFESEGIKVGTTTIYRNLDRLVAQGVVAKYVIDGTSSACFEYIGHEEHDDCHGCYHCKCEVCGKIIHLECDEVKCLGDHIMKDHGFEINYHRTVFYGICEACRSEETWD